MDWFLVAVFGALGAITRYVVDRAIMTRLATDFPVGTLMINLSGALVLGMVTGLATRNLLSTDAVVAIGDGFIGAYTTFSTLTFETLSLVGAESLALGSLNMVGTVVAATILAYLGIHIVR
ncbi:fluoride efflux transporter CrcB [Ferrimicrobium acidiphilum]|jgi:CrcB protein|uniref:Fluoride-specific ion channel FluC n=1 Tax=Ferrimicrobium acidiphilum DSM 19497 TaxID=1121877 RepID=A0A0D8FXS7_9ACTN|nr:fluoride efflux transporter CrcB [Ferrimicrobium acidiphilum]KJE77754.1 putative fluoride ion transporter CrcB [Ferrimicrobium acidiphilum DSM 19497]MCL5053298.1 fluoride efflux transporter CrcB [Gammaproteobacteria bacterium]